MPDLIPVHLYSLRHIWMMVLQEPKRIRKDYMRIPSENIPSVSLDDWLDNSMDFMQSYVGYGLFSDTPLE